MDAKIDHYKVLGLPSGEKGAKLTSKEISKAYKQKALELHPDKRHDDPNAHDNFQKLKSSYEVLKDGIARKCFDELLRVRIFREEKKHINKQFDAKRRRMVSDLDKRERECAATNLEKKAREEEERIKRKLGEDIAGIRAMYKKTKMSEVKSKATGGVAFDNTNVLKVTWEKGVWDYSASRLREIFEKFGQVKDVIINSFDEKESAVIVMASKEDALAATGTLCGDLSNPLLVLPLQPAAYPEPYGLPTKNIVGIGLQAFENNVLDKFRKAAQEQNIKMATKYSTIDAEVH